MPVNEQFCQMLGLAMRAGQLSTGESGFRQSAAQGEAILLLVDGAASDNTKKRIADCAAYYGLPLAEVEPGRLGACIGRDGRMSAAVKKGPLGKKLLALAGTDTTLSDGH